MQTFTHRYLFSLMYVSEVRLPFYLHEIRNTTSLKEIQYIFLDITGN